MSIHCGLLDNEIPHTSTPSVLSLEYENLSLSLRSTLGCHHVPIDSIASVIVVSGGELCVIQTPEKDYIIKSVEVEELLEEAFSHFARKNRAVHKYVKYHYEEVEDMALWDPNYEICRSIRKTIHDRPPILPFPHTKLDFLKLHLNRSVMIRLSSNNDKSIELSCDQVAVSGYPFACLPEAKVDGEILSQFKNNVVFDQVLILTDKTLFITQPTGVVQGLISLDSCSMRPLKQYTEGGGSGDSKNFIYIEHQTGRTVLHTKFATDVMTRRNQLFGPCSTIKARAASPTSADQKRKVPTSEKSVQVDPDDYFFDEDTFSRVIRKDGPSTAAVMTLSARVEELEEMVERRNEIIEGLQNDMASSSPQSRNQKMSVSHSVAALKASQNRKDKSSFAANGEAGIFNSLSSSSSLFQYIALLEDEIKGFKNNSISDRVKLLEGNLYMDLPRDETALHHALLDARRRESALKMRMRRLEEKNEAMESATKVLLAELSERVNFSIEKFMRNYKAPEKIESHMHQIRRLIRTAEDRAADETNRRTKLLKGQVKKLLDELLFRDEAFDNLLEEKDIRAHAISTQTRLMKDLMMTNDSLSAEADDLRRRVSDLESTAQYLEEEIIEKLQHASPLEPTAIDLLQAKNDALCELSYIPNAIKTIADLSEQLSQHTKRVVVQAQAKSSAEWKVGTVNL